MISIIIPVWNRATLIVETMVSIVNQTYPNWECILIDDGSTDGTQQVIYDYIKQDSRFQLIERTTQFKKGAPSCRNIGLNKAKGAFIQFFDSDDIMVRTMLADKLTAIQSGDYDFVISRTQSFKHPDLNYRLDNYEKYYQFDKYPITNYHYTRQHINWLTPDFLGKSSLVKQLRFNEVLKSGQEFNFFAKLTVFSSKAIILNKATTLRRIHTDSIRGSLKKNPIEEIRQKSLLFENTYLDLEEIGASQASLHGIIFQMAENYLMNGIKLTGLRFLFKNLLLVKGFMFCTRFIYYTIILKPFNRGYGIRKELLHELNH